MPIVERTPGRASLVLVSVLALVLTLVPPALVGAQEDPLHDRVVISELATRGPGGATDNFVEVTNSSGEPVDVSGWDIQRCNNNNFTGSQVGIGDDVVLEPGDSYLVAHATGYTGQRAPDASYPISIADDGGVRVLDADGELVDRVGFGSPDTNACVEGAAAVPLSAAEGNDGLSHHRVADTADNATDFAKAPRSVDDVEPGEPEEVSVVCPAGVRTVEGYATDGAVGASSDDAEIVALEITGVDPEPTVGEIVLDDVVTGAEASATLVVGDDVRRTTPTAPSDLGDLAVEITATDDTGATGTCTAAIDLIPLVPIGAVQGSIADGQTSFTSPLLNGEVAVRGVVAQLTREGNGNRGLLLQNRPEDADGDDRSSDGIFVFNGNFTTLRTDFDGPANDELGANYDVVVGDEIVLRGQVDQFFGMTQFGGGSSFVWDQTDSGLDVEAVVEIAEVDPPDDAGDSLRYFRRHLGMQMQVPADSLVVGGRDVFGGTDAEVWAIRGDHDVAQRDDPYARRVFRDAHPLDNNPGELFDDGNGYRFVLGSFGLKGAQDDPDAVLAPAKTFDTITRVTTGGVMLSFGKYTINVADQIELDTGGVEPADNAPIQPVDRDTQFTVGAYNVENLYDTRSNPNSGCDTPDGPGCPGVSPPFDYLPESEEYYQQRMQRMAEQIRLDLGEPDVVMIQETESQDVCSISEDWTPDWDPSSGEDRLDCDLENTGDDNTRSSRSPDSLLELSLIIQEQGGAAYDVVFDINSGDARGIVQAFLYRSDRVELVEPDATDPVLGDDPTIDYDGELLDFTQVTANPKSINAQRPPDFVCGSTPLNCDGDNVFSRGPNVGLFRIWQGAVGEGASEEVYLVNNHQSAGPDARVLQRTEQATLNARIAEAVLDADPDANVIVGGDLNVFPRPDDPYAPGQPIAGDLVGPSDQLAALYGPLVNLYDVQLDRTPSSAYTFGFQGQVQTLDHLFVSDALRDGLVDVRSAKINVDYPADASGEDPTYGRFGVSDHDPELATFAFDDLPDPDPDLSFDDVRQQVADYVADGAIRPQTGARVDRVLDRAEALVEQGRPVPAIVLLHAKALVLDIEAALAAVLSRLPVFGPLPGGQDPAALRAVAASLRELADGIG